jgi:Ni,Fe-hydrogenase I cytochrome b subunit
MPIDVKYYPGRKSRVVSSFWQFLFGSALNILRAYRDYAPLRFFGTLSAVCFFIGAITGGFVARHWVINGAISPYISVGIFALFFVALGIVFALIGLVTDMFDRMINNQEKILEELKIARYSSSKTNR